DKIALGVSFTGDPAVGVLRQAGIQHRIGDCVTDFVGATFTHGLGREDKVFAHEIAGVSNIILTYQDKMIYCFERTSTGFAKKMSRALFPRSSRVPLCCIAESYSAGRLSWPCRLEPAVQQNETSETLRVTS